jgi:hypothetical protein
MIALFMANIWRAIAIAAVVAGLWQTNRIEGWVVLNGLEQDVADCEARTTAEIQSHQKTKSDYANAQRIAGLEQAVKVAAVEAEQERVTRERSNSYRDRIADLDRRMLELSGSRAELERLTGEPRLPDVPTSTDGVEAAPGDLAVAERVTCIRQAIQLDELINWTKDQAGSDRFSDIPVTE